MSLTLQQRARIAVQVVIEDDSGSLQRLADALTVLAQVVIGLCRFVAGAVEVVLSAVDALAAGIIAVETRLIGWSIRWQMTLIVLGLLFYEIRNQSFNT